MNTRNLKKRAQGWAAVYYVPVKDRGLTVPNNYIGPLGKPGATIGREIVRGLGTRDLQEAHRKKQAVLGQIAVDLAAISGDTDPRKSALNIASHYDGSASSEHEIEVVAESLFDTFSGDEDEAQEYQKFIEIASRKTIPVSLALDAWMNAADGLASETAYQYRNDVDQFVKWSNDPAIKGVTEDLAGQYYSHLIQTPTRNNTRIAPNTLQRKIGSLNRLWKWMKKRKLHKGSNPWIELLEQAPGEKKRGTGVLNRRALKRDEAQKYLSAVQSMNSKYKQAGSDVIILFWHTGARPNDLMNLNTDFVEWDEKLSIYWINLDAGKTVNNPRVVPVVSPEAIQVLARRIEKAEKGVLFHEVAPDKKHHNRYARLQKIINPLRRKVLKGVNVDTYSCRRSFSVACEEVGLDPIHHSRLMGHEAPTLASAVYNRGQEGRKRMLEGIRKVDQQLGELT